VTTVIRANLNAVQAYYLINDNIAKTRAMLQVQQITMS